MSKLLITGLYTLTPTHCGTGQAMGAIDLPIAREAHTYLPLLPATTLKGVVRDGVRSWGWFKEEQQEDETLLARLFGLEPPRRRGRNGQADGEPEVREKERRQSLTAGDLVFFDAQLLAFPVRSLTGVFRLVTSPLLLQRLQRLAGAHDLDLSPDFSCPSPEEGEALVADERAMPLSLEDLVIPKDRCRLDERVVKLAKALGPFVANDENDADRKALEKRLVVVEDALLQDLTRRATQVSARIVLNRDSKTSANLWYEETLPPDCLFAAPLAARPGARDEPLEAFRQALKGREYYAQIGGNGSVGCGQCRWALEP